MRNIKLEYSDISNREILWMWICFGGLVLQGVFFILSQLNSSPLCDALYIVISIPNATFFCFCTYRQRVLDLDVEQEIELGSETTAKIDDKAFYSYIEEKLKKLCEDKCLFLDPDLTRETLCLRLGINHTYLNMYLRSRGLSYYQYINTLRIEYAYRLMQDNPDMPIKEIAKCSGFRSQPTFRKMFQEVVGSLPSEIRK